MKTYTNWQELPGGWHQKIYFSGTTEPVYTYHYGNKLQKAETILVIKTHLAEQVCSYKLI